LHLLRRWIRLHLSDLYRRCLGLSDLPVRLRRPLLWDLSDQMRQGLRALPVNQASQVLLPLLRHLLLLPGQLRHQRRSGQALLPPLLGLSVLLRSGLDNQENCLVCR
jgi:hypothetical protein